MTSLVASSHTLKISGAGRVASVADVDVNEINDVIVATVHKVRYRFLNFLHRFQ
jgi:hypothetical protein